jgi:hypothetical protein
MGGTKIQGARRTLFAVANRSTTDGVGTTPTTADAENF